MKCLVSCPRRVLLVDLDTREVGVVEAHRPEYYGISWTLDGRQLCLSHSSVDNAGLGTMESYLDAEQGQLSLGGRLGPRCLAAPHQVLCLPSHVVATNTGRNCLTIFNPADLFYQNRWLDDVRWDRKGRDKDCGSHFNSLIYRDGRLYVLAHNFDRGSYILVLAWPGLEVVERIETRITHGHNVWPWPGGAIAACDSMAGALVEARSGQVLWRRDGLLLRGLACHGNIVLIGGSPFTSAVDRPTADGCLFIVDRTTWKVIDEMPLPGAGVVHDLRIVDRPDECHHGQPLRHLPMIDAPATKKYLQAASGGRKPPDMPAMPLRGLTPPARPSAKFRIGFWPAQLSDVLPDGNAVRIYPLAADFDGLAGPLIEALLQADEHLEVVIMDRSSSGGLRTTANRVMQPRGWPDAMEPRMIRFIDGWLGWADRHERLCDSSRQLGRRVRGRGRACLDLLGRGMGRGNVGCWLAALLVLPLVLLVAWLMGAVAHLLAGLFRGLLLPVAAWHRLLRRGRQTLRRRAVGRARAAGCAAWVIPAVRRGSPPDWVHHVEWGRSAEKLLLPAAPITFPKIAGPDFRRLLPRALVRPYLLVPAAAQPGRLVDHLRRAVDLLDGPPLDLVFWSVEGPPPADPRVHVVAAVDPRVRAALFHEASAALLPALAPDTLTTIAEALHWGCPLLAAGAPALLPLVRPFGDTLALFDAAHPESIARAVQQTREDRDWHHSLQKEAARELWERGWAEAARELVQLARPAAAEAAATPAPRYRPSFHTASGR